MPGDPRFATCADRKANRGVPNRCIAAAIAAPRAGGAICAAEPPDGPVRRSRMEPETDPSPTALTARLDRLERLATDMDSRFRVPGTKIRFGWDSIIGLVPGIGDVASLAPAGYILLEAHRMGAPKALVGRMAVNAGLDWAVGSVPVLGDALDVWIKANRRNVALLRAHFGRPASVERPPLASVR